MYNLNGRANKECSRNYHYNYYTTSTNIIITLVSIYTSSLLNLNKYTKNDIYMLFNLTNLVLNLVNNKQYFVD